MTVLERAIEALRAVRDELLTLTAGWGTARRCMAVSDWGRCQLVEHADEHDFPTEQDHEATMVAYGRRVHRGSAMIDS